MFNDKSTTEIYLCQISEFPPLSPEEESELAAEVKNGNCAARDRMIRSKLRLVVKIARDYAHLGVALSDLIAEGNIGLIKAIDRFDPTKGAKLSTYAAWWIRRAIINAVRTQGKTIRLPHHVAIKMAKIQSIAVQLCAELGRDPTLEELALESGISTQRLARISTCPIQLVSLDAPLNDEESSTLAQTLSDENAPSAFELLRDKNQRQELYGLLRCLGERERSIIFERFGFDSEPKTFEEIGKDFHIRGERVWQIYNTALEKLRNAMSRLEGARRPPANERGRHRIWGDFLAPRRSL
jgi:RNA polymerase primary sigma factor